MDIEDLYRRYGPMVIRRCRQILKDEDEALEVSQDVFVQLLRRRETLQVRQPSTLLYRMATNLSLNRIRDRKRKPATNDDEFLHRLASLEEPTARLEARSVLERLFGMHQESSHVIAVLHFVDGLTLAEVANNVGMSVSGVRKRLDAIRKSLADMEEL